jgi:hypothetical protein
VGVKRRPYFILRLLLRAFARLELSITAFADADGWQRRLYDPKLARVHDQSLAHRRAGVEINGNQGGTARGGYGEHDNALYQWGIEGDPNKDSGSIKVQGEDIVVFNYEDYWHPSSEVP